MMRCKMVIGEVAESMGSKPDADGKWITCKFKTVKMLAVSGGSDENKRFWSATPSGKLDLTCVHPDAIEGMEVGKEFYVDISPA